MTLDDFKAREIEYREWLQKRILERDSKIVQSEKTYLAQHNVPIRHPEERDRHTRHWFWSDAIWCGDISMAWPEEFFFDPLESNYEVKRDEFIDLMCNGDEFQIWFNNVFDDVFKSVMPPELHDVLEG